MFLDSQNQFRDQMERHLRGAPLNLEPGYAEAYALWEQENKEVLYKLSAEERTQSFADSLEKTVRERLLARVNAPESKELANRGQLLLASTDGGKNFETVLDPEENNLKPTDYLLLSPTFRSATLNFREVRDEQSLIHVVSKLRDQHFLVERAWVEKEVVHVDAVHPRAGTYEVQVNLDQARTAPLVYEFINALGKAAVPETQLPEKYGELKAQNELQEMSTATQLTLNARTKDEEAKKLQAAMAGSMAAWTMLASKRADTAAQLTRQHLERPLAANQGELHVPNIMAAKAAMAARFARQGQVLAEGKKREMQRMEVAKESQRQAVQEQKAAEQKRRQQRTSQQKTIAQGTAIGAGIFGGLLGAVGGTGWFVSHINLFS